MKKLSGLIALWALVIAGFVAVAYSANTCTSSDMYCFQSGPSQSVNTIGRLDSSGNLTVVGNGTMNGKTIFVPQSVTAVSTLTTLSPTATYLQIISSGGPVNIGLQNAAISTTSASAGQYLIIGSTSSTSTVTITTGSVAGVLSISTNTILINNVRRPSFIYDSTNSVWVQTTAPAQQ